MDRKPVDLPAGVELVGRSIRIRFTWNKKRCCETLPLPQTAKGIAAAASLRAQVRGLDKLGAFKADTLPVGSLAMYRAKAQMIFDRAGYR